MTSRPRFLYFDLGNVLLHFDHQQMCRQMAEVAGMGFDQVRQVVFEDGLQHQLELGEIDTRHWFDEFCRRTGTQPDYAPFVRAACDIFQLNLSIVPVIGQLVAANNPLGILSNTSDLHWGYVTSGRFGMIPAMFRVLVLSHEVHAAKPDPAIYARAAELADCEPHEIFYVDDLLENVAAAREAGFDAVQFVGTNDLVIALQARGVKFNY